MPVRADSYAGDYKQFPHPYTEGIACAVFWHFPALHPRKRLYASFEDYAENERGFSYDEEHGGYGYICNPNVMWDWYQIGGRWPEMFLIKDSCIDYSVGERSWCNGDVKLVAPEGYIWVCAAKKKDIEWQVMREWREKKARERFSKLEKIFVTGQYEEDFRGSITPQGVLCYGEMVYFKGETVEDYLKRRIWVQGRNLWNCQIPTRFLLRKKIFIEKASQFM